MAAMKPNAIPAKETQWIGFHAACTEWIFFFLLQIELDSLSKWFRSMFNLWTVEMLHAKEENQCAMAYCANECGTQETELHWANINYQQNHCHFALPSKMIALKARKTAQRKKKKTSKFKENFCTSPAFLFIFWFIFLHFLRTFFFSLSCSLPCLCAVRL